MTDSIHKSFIANVSHEIRTPLNAIIGFAEGIAQADSIETAQGYAKTIVCESEHLLGILNQVLDYAKIEAGQMDIEHRPADLAKLIHDMGNSARTQAQDKGLQFHVSVDHDVPPYVKGDAIRLRQVLMNLINNAIKFTQEGSITLNVTLQKVDANHYIRFDVIDTGVGITPEKQAIIFESFAQGDASATRKFGGIGLGISTSRKLVGLMHGRIGLESQPGKGSTFWFVVPCTEQDIPSEAEELSLMAENYDYEPAPVHQARILVVEDYAPNQDVVNMHLTNAGHIVDVAENGKEAVQACEKNSYDLILMDVQMPEMNGIDATNIIRTGDSSCQNVPIIALTANAEGDTKKSCLQAGMNDVITKPIRRKPLLNSINKWLDPCTDQASQDQCLPASHADDGGDQSENVTQKFILVAEDSELIQHTMRVRLSSAGFRVDIAENGGQAAEMCEKNCYDLVLMDVQMPKIDGLEATRRIRSGSAAHRDIPIIGLTADVGSDSRQTCLDAGMNDVISKAVRGKHFLTVLSTWMNVPAQAEMTCGGETQCPCHAPAAGKQKDVPLDLEEAVREFGGNRELVNSVIEKFLDMAESQIKVLKEALKKQDNETIRKEAHKIRGGAANLTAMSLSMVAEKLEGIAQTGTRDEIEEQLILLEEEFDKLKQFV
jgi:two-component system, sensor histidine kinase and response regulator